MCPSCRKVRGVFLGRGENPSETRGTVWPPRFPFATSTTPTSKTKSNTSSERHILRGCQAIGVRVHADARGRPGCRGHRGHRGARPNSPMRAGTPVLPCGAEVTRDPELHGVRANTGALGACGTILWNIITCKNVQRDAQWAPISTFKVGIEGCIGTVF